MFSKTMANFSQRRITTILKIYYFPNSIHFFLNEANFVYWVKKPRSHLYANLFFRLELLDAEGQNICID